MKTPRGVTVSKPYSVKNENGTFTMYWDINVKWWYKIYALINVAMGDKSVGWWKWFILPIVIFRALRHWQQSQEGK